MRPANAMAMARKHNRPSRAMSTADVARDDLRELRNVGPAMRADFALLGIENIKQLARCDADELYLRLQKLTGHHHDPCVWDTFAAAIHQARTGEGLPWWQFTRLRKQRQAQGTFNVQFDKSKRAAR